MPSVRIEQLERESQALAELFTDAPKLVRALDLHFERYAQRSKRQGQVRPNPRVLHSYDVPTPVIKQIRQELFPLVRDQAKEGLLLIDALWLRRTIEHRELAIYLLGQLPVNRFRNVSARIQSWSAENREESLISVLAKDASHNMRSADPDALMSICKRLFKKGDMRVRATGLMIANSMMAELSLDHLPAILELIIPLAKKPVKGLRPYLLDNMKTLIEKSPGEGLYFLQQRLAESPGAGTRWMAKQSLKYFPSYEARILEESLGG